MSERVPRTVKAVDATTLVALDDEARNRGFNRHHGSGWLMANADMSAQHYLYPFMVHRTDHRPEFSPHWRCMVLLRMHDGQEVSSLLDIWPPTFTQISESLTVQEKTSVAGRLEGGGFPTVASWVDSSTRTRASGKGRELRTVIMPSAWATSQCGIRVHQPIIFTHWL